jgi:hypothetical protein
MSQGTAKAMPEGNTAKTAWKGIDHDDVQTCPVAGTAGL